MFLGLIEEKPDRVELTALGREVIRYVTGRYGSVEAGLAESRTGIGSSNDSTTSLRGGGDFAGRAEFLVSPDSGFHLDGYVVELAVVLQLSSEILDVGPFIAPLGEQAEVSEVIAEAIVGLLVGRFITAGILIMVARF